MSRFLSPFLRSFAPMFRPPFDGLWLLVVLYYGWCFFVYPHSQVLRGNLPDPDDYMYLAQVMDWLQGQSWFNNIQHRLNPPDGVPIHFSRFAQLPMAAMIWLFHKLGLPLRGSAMLMAWLYPLFLLTAFLFALRTLAESFVPKDWAGVTAFTALFATGMMFMFTPGHVDHHGLIIVLVTVTLGYVMRLTEEPSDWRAGMYAGFVMALGLTVALEILPWLLLIAGFLGIWGTIKGGAAARSGLVFALSLYLASAAFLILTRPLSDWANPDVLTYSIVYVFLTGGIAIGFAAAAAAAEAAAPIRWGMGGGFAVLSGYLFLHNFPELIAGPYGGMDPELARMMLGELDEAKPLLASEDGFWGILIPIGGCLIALGASSHFLRVAKRDERWRWALLLTLLVAGLALTSFYQYRFMGLTSMLTIIPMTVLLQRGWVHIGKSMKGRKKVFAEIGLLLLVGPLPAVLFPAVIDNRAFNKGILLFPVDASVTRSPCDTYVLEKILDDPALYGSKPRLIVSSIGQGPELLFRTPHEVLSAPFHMDVTGNIDATRFFSTPYASEAEAIARRRHIDLVVACRFVPDIYTRPPEAKAGTSTGGSGKDFAPHFIELLMTGHAPKWLKQVPFPTLHNFVIFEVKPADEAPKKSAAPR